MMLNRLMGLFSSDIGIDLGTDITGKKQIGRAHV